jgi:HK97 family phage portal protein
VSSKFSRMFQKMQNLGVGFVYEGTRYHPTQRNLENFYKEGFLNVVGYRCIKEIAKAASSIDIEIWEGDTEVLEGEIYDLLKRPNPMQSKGKFFTDAIVSYQFAGNTYLFKNAEAKEKKCPTELYVLPPHTMETVSGTTPLPSKYILTAGVGKQIEYPVDQATGDSQILQVRDINPKNPLMGISALEAATYFIDMHNHGAEWNVSLLKNGASIKSMISTEGSVDKATESRLKEYFKSEYTGAQNAGKPIIMTGGKFDAKQLSMSPADMDYEKTMNMASKNIAAAFGVPYALVLEDSGTYSNMAEARLMLYENTIIPMLKEFLEELSRWLSFNLDRDIELRIDEDNIPALAIKRESKINQVEKLVARGIITRDEARVELDYEKRNGIADELFISTSEIPINDAGLSDLSNNDPANPDPLNDPKDTANKTNFPQKGQHLEVKMKNSQYLQFDKRYADDIKNNYPDIWSKGVKTGFKNEEEFLRAREEWASRNLHNHSLIACVSAMKMDVVLACGMKRMKDIIETAIKKQK